MCNWHNVLMSGWTASFKFFKLSGTAFLRKRHLRDSIWWRSPCGLTQKRKSGNFISPTVWVQKCNHNMFPMEWCKWDFRAQRPHMIGSKGLEYLRPYLINRERKAVFFSSFPRSWKKEIIIQEIEVYELENMNLIFLKAFIKKIIIGSSLMIGSSTSEKSGMR